jgi:hypothetical protein
MLINLEDEDDDIFRSCTFYYYFIRPQVSDVYYHDLNGNVVVKRCNPVVTRYTRLNSIDGEQYFYQLLLLNINFRVFAELISDAYLTKLIKKKPLLGVYFMKKNQMFKLILKIIIARIMQDLI